MISLSISQNRMQAKRNWGKLRDSTGGKERFHEYYIKRSRQVNQHNNIIRWDKM